MQESIKNIIDLNKNDLDVVKEHTKYKIKYVKKYVECWLRVVTNMPNVKNINFIDCMCNAGVYQNGVLSTSIEVLKLFVEFSANHPDKKFNLFLNDNDEKRIKITKEILKLFNYNQYNNINIYCNTGDVNEYLDNLINSSFFRKDNNFIHSTILYVDPYNLGDVKIKKIINFTNKFYSEVIFNYFNSDYRRNISNSSAANKTKKIIDSMEGIEGFQPDMDEMEVEKLIRLSLKGNNIKYSFSYPFRIKTNVELYHIIFATPNRKGLIELKESLWDVFNGDTYFKSANINPNQLTLFEKEDIRDMHVQNFAIEAKELVINKFKNMTVDYKAISDFVLENTMLKETHIIKYLLNPLIDENKIIKNNIVSNRDYKNDNYTFLCSNDLKIGI